MPQGRQNNIENTPESSIFHKMDTKHQQNHHLYSNTLTLFQVREMDDISLQYGI